MGNSNNYKNGVTKTKKVICNWCAWKGFCLIYFVFQKELHPPCIPKLTSVFSEAEMGLCTWASLLIHISHEHICVYSFSVCAHVCVCVWAVANSQGTFLVVALLCVYPLSRGTVPISWVACLPSPCLVTSTFVLVSWPLFSCTRDLNINVWCKPKCVCPSVNESGEVYWDKWVVSGVPQ